MVVSDAETSLIGNIKRLGCRENGSPALRLSGWESDAGFVAAFAHYTNLLSQKMKRAWRL